MTRISNLKAMLKAVDKDLDGQVSHAQSSGASVLECAMMDKVMREWCKLLEMQRVMQQDPDDYIDATFWIIAIMINEVMLNTHDRKAPEMIYARMNHELRNLGDMIADMLKKSLTNESKPH